MPEGVIAQVSITRNPLLLIAVPVFPTCPATQLAKKVLINTCCGSRQLAACRGGGDGDGDERRAVAGRD